MAYLDISPMLTALREAPAEFDLRGGQLRHIPSRHTFGFTLEGRAIVTRTRCECVSLIINDRQSTALKSALREWTVSYWEPLLVRQAEARRIARINREFARHFRPGLHRLLDRIAALWRRPEPAGRTDPAPIG
jgi:hypothetical protein